MVLARMQVACLFLRTLAVIKFVLRAASTLENKDSEQRALHEFSAGRNLFFIERNVLHEVMN